MTVKRYLMFLFLFVIIFAFVAAVSMDINVKKYDEYLPVFYDDIVTPKSVEVTTTQGNISTAISPSPYLVVGSASTPFRYTTKTLELIKKPYQRIAKVADIDVTTSYSAVIMTNEFYEAKDILVIKKLIANKIPIIFAVMPSISSIRDTELSKLLGITSIGERARQKDILIIDGFLLGGRMNYSNVNTNSYKVSLESSCKTIIRADDKKLDITNEEQNVLLWRTYIDDVPVHVFNNTLMFSDSGIGCLVSALALEQDAFAYPIIDSYTVSLLGFPLGDEYDNESMIKFNRDTQGALKDIIFPDLILLASKTNMRLTFFSEKQEESFDYWAKEMQKLKFLLFDDKTLNTDTLIETGTGFLIDNDEELKTRSLVTGLGIINNTADMDQVFSLDKDYDWRILSKDLASKVYAHSTFFPWLNKQTLDRTVVAMNEYYQLTPHISYTQNEVNIQCEQLKESASFIVRLNHKRIDSTLDAEVIPIEEGVYKVTITTPNVSLKLVDLED